MEYGLIGKKLGHSYSKEIHEAIMDYKYDLCELTEEEIPEFFEKKEFKAINVTVPYKQVVIPYLDYIEENALAIHAVNTIVNKDGKLYGYNTDFDGVIALLNHLNVSLENKNVLILGTGGTSNTVKAVCDFQHAKQATKVSRSGKDGCLSYQEAQQQKDIDVIINTTPCGMYPDNYGKLIDLAAFEQLSAVIDVVYNPLNTSLVMQAKQLGIPSEGGLYMLVAQAVKAIEYFKDIQLDEELILKQFQKIRGKKLNAVIIGMPGSGKSTISVMLSKDLNMPLVDSDLQVVKSAGCSIPEIFAKEGEAGFRDKETIAIKELAKLNGSIISTGGGCILRQENINALRQNGVIFYLVRDVEKLQAGNGRPLSQNLEDNKKRFKERKEKYESSCDYAIDNNGDITTTVEKIKEIMHEISGN